LNRAPRITTFEVFLKPPQPNPFRKDGIRPMHRILLGFLALVVLAVCSLRAEEPGQFAVEKNHFVLNGKPFQVLSGEMHYPRIPREYWHDRLLKARAMGLNTVCTYLFWNLHEPKPGEFVFDGNLDVAAFIREAQKVGLYVIIRPGPYVCSEWDFGGLPSWLLKEPDIKVRCMDPHYMAAVERYINRVADELRPLQISGGGPIIMCQVENEYGSYGNDKVYLRTLRDMLRKAGFTVQLFTSDGGTQSCLEAGTLEDVLPVVNFGDGPEGNFAALEKFRSGIPEMCGEFWVGWFTHWGTDKWGSSDAQRQKGELEWMLKTGKSVNLYMFHGGTNFGFTAGANYGQGYEPDVTSYDYDSPLDESGNPSPKFTILRDILKKYQHAGATIPELPQPQPAIEIPAIRLTEQAPLFASLPDPLRAVQPKWMEAYDQAYGLILYRTKLIGPHSGKLVFADLHDYASVYLNGKLVGRVDRVLGEKSIEIPEGAGTNATLDILVEGMGRINFGPHLLDRKGITNRVTLSNVTLMNWEVFLLPLDTKYLSGVKYGAFDSTAAPAFSRGFFDLAKVGDTYIDMKGWKKGFVWVNDHNLGRFWSIGPQERLYIPGVWLVKGKNEIVVFDIDEPRAQTLKCVKNAK
jgi:beta-galactosidase